MTTSILMRTDLAGPYRVSAERVPQLRAEMDGLADKPDFQWVNSEATGKLPLDLQVMATALSFPAHFGANFDALYDCLCDTEVVSAKYLVLVFEQANRWPEEDRDTLIAVLQAVADEWREQGRCLWSLFASLKLDLDPLPSA